MNAAPLTEPQVLAALRQVIDPELGLNLVDLGFIYNVAVHNRSVTVHMTLTSPGCPMQQSLTHGVRLALEQLPSVETVAVELVWDPPWSADRMTPEGRAQVGMP